MDLEELLFFNFMQEQEQKEDYIQVNIDLKDLLERGELTKSQEQE